MQRSLLITPIVFANISPPHPPITISQLPKDTSLPPPNYNLHTIPLLLIVDKYHYSNHFPTRILPLLTITSPDTSTKDSPVFIILQLSKLYSHFPPPFKPNDIPLTSANLKLFETPESTVKLSSFWCFLPEKSIYFSCCKVSLHQKQKSELFKKFNRFYIV